MSPNKTTFLDKILSLQRTRCTIISVMLQAIKSNSSEHKLKIPHHLSASQKKKKMPTYDLSPCLYFFL